MATIIKYTNRFGREITKQQLSKISSYHKVMEIDDVTKTIEKYYNDGLLCVFYYLDPGESNTVVLETLRETHPLSKFFAIYEKIVFEEYTLEVERKYSLDDDTPVIFKFLYDANNQLICKESTSIGEAFLLDDTHHTESIRTKYLHDRSHYMLYFTCSEGFEGLDFQVLEAHYKPDGSLDYIRYGDSYAHERRIYSAAEYSALVLQCRFNEAQEAYYLTDVFFPAD